MSRKHVVNASVLSFLEPSLGWDVVLSVSVHGLGLVTAGGSWQFKLQWRYDSLACLSGSPIVLDSNDALVC